VVIQETDAPKPASGWFIDRDWLKQNNRSLSALARSSLCARCRKQSDAEEKELTETELLKTIKSCCQQDPEYITEHMPILESIFRLLLANGNRPLSLDELARQLSERRGGFGSHTPREALSRLLAGDQYYGLRPAAD
jgi:hypothetical protein